MRDLFGNPVAPIRRPGACDQMIGGLWGRRCCKPARRVVFGALGSLHLCCDDCMPEAIRIGWVEVPEEELVVMDVLNS